MRDFLQTLQTSLVKSKLDLLLLLLDISSWKSVIDWDLDLIWEGLGKDSIDDFLELLFFGGEEGGLAYLVVPSNFLSVTMSLADILRGDKSNSDDRLEAISANEANEPCFSGVDWIDSDSKFGSTACVDNLPSRLRVGVVESACGGNPNRLLRSLIAGSKLTFSLFLFLNLGLRFLSKERCGDVSKQFGHDG